MATLPNGQHMYTQEEDEWLMQNIDTGTYAEITARFNEKYGTNIKCVSDHTIKVLHIHKKINSGDCKKGERRCKNALPIGAESFDGFNVYVKVSDSVNNCKNRRMPTKRYDPNWTRKDYLVWQEHGHKIPKDSNQMLIHLNGDKKDCSIENLYMTTRTVNMQMVKNGWYSEDMDITLAGIKWCELVQALRERGWYERANHDTDYGEQLFDFCSYCGNKMEGKKNETN